MTPSIALASPLNKNMSSSSFLDIDLEKAIKIQQNFERQRELLLREFSPRQADTTSNHQNLGNSMISSKNGRQSSLSRRQEYPDFKDKSQAKHAVEVILFNILQFYYRLCSGRCSDNQKDRILISVIKTGRA